jgi:hypothetical protein
MVRRAGLRSRPDLKPVEFHQATAADCQTETASATCKSSYYSTLSVVRQDATSSLVSNKVNCGQGWDGGLSRLRITRRLCTLEHVNWLGALVQTFGSGRSSSRRSCQISVGNSTELGRYTDTVVGSKGVVRHVPYASERQMGVSCVQQATEAPRKSHSRTTSTSRSVMVEGSPFRPLSLFFRKAGRW